MINKLVDKIKKQNAPVVVGLDPMMKFVPKHLQDAAFKEYGETLEGAAEAIWQFNKAIIDNIYDIVPAVKPQVAMYEQFGIPGMIAFKKTVDYCHEKDMVVIGDVKRGDIGSTSEAYAVAHLGKVKVGNKEIAAFDDEDANSVIGKIVDKLSDAELKLTLVSAEKAPYHFKLHYEKLPDQTTQYVKKCTYDENALATYTTKYGEKETLDCPEFTFDYPVERWSIDTEEYDSSENGGPGAVLLERVVLKSKHGATIEFRRFSTDDLGYGGAYWAWKYKISKVADSKFKPGYGVGTDHDYSKDLGKMVVAKCKLIGEMDGQVDEDFKKPSESNYYYAILPQSKLGTREDYDGTGAEDLFGYVSYFSFTSCTNEEFDKQDEKDILTIMDSFRESEEDIVR